MSTSSVRYLDWRVKSRLACTPEGFWDLSLPSWLSICTFVVPHAKFILSRPSKADGKDTLAYRQTLGLTASYPVSSCDSPVAEDLKGCSFLPCHTAASPVWWHPVEGWRWGQAVTDATGASQLILYCTSPKPTSFWSLLQRILDVVRMISLTPIPTTAS